SHQRRAMRRAYAEKGPGMRKMRETMRGDFEAVLTELRAVPFDPAQFRAAVESQSSRMAARSDAGREALVGLVVSMSDAERSAFVERLEKSLSRRGEKADRDAGKTKGN
ncbi:MAG: periplasmic heavy metal sensor, partial [Paracoccaceae bacterium]